MSKSTISTIAIGLDALANPAAPVAPIDPELAKFVDAVIMLDEAGILASTIADARAKAAAKTAPKPARKPAPARKARTRKLDPAVGTGDSMRVTLSGKTMPNTAGSITDAQFARITGGWTRTQIAAAAKSLKLTGSLKTASMADASDIHTTLKGA